MGRPATEDVAFCGIQNKVLEAAVLEGVVGVFAGPVCRPHPASPFVAR
jgi:hypothetical protein